MAGFLVCFEAILSINSFQPTLMWSAWTMTWKASRASVANQKNEGGKKGYCTTSGCSGDKSYRRPRWKVREGGASSCCVDLPAGLTVFFELHWNLDASLCFRSPSGSFIKIIYDAYQRMKESKRYCKVLQIWIHSKLWLKQESVSLNQETGAFLWGLSTSQNPRCLGILVCN